MVRSLLAGMTDYSNQSLDDIGNDIVEWIGNLNDTKKQYDEVIIELENSGYWSQVSYDFKNLCYSTCKLFDTALKELSEVKLALSSNVEDYHVRILRNLGQQGHVYYRHFGEVWHKYYDNKDYGNENFILVEDLYGNGRDMVADMIDLSNLASRMEDFVGRKASNDITNKVIINQFHGGVNNLQQNYDDSIGVQDIKYSERNSAIDVIEQIKTIVTLIPQEEKQEVREYMDNLQELAK